MIFETVKKAELNDRVTGDTHSLAALLIEYGNEIPIGRTKDNAIVLGLGGISSSHVTIVYDGKIRKYFIRDNDSTNGTVLIRKDKDESPIPLEPHQLYPLKDGDRLCFSGEAKRFLESSRRGGRMEFNPKHSYNMTYEEPTEPAA